jgi:ribosome-associated protein
MRQGFVFEIGHPFLHPDIGGDLFDEFRPRGGEFEFGSGAIEIGLRAFGLRAREHACADELLRVGESALAAQHHALGDVDHLVGLFRQQVGAVEVPLQDGHVHRILDVILRFAETGERQGAGFDEFADLIDVLLRADDERVGHVGRERRNLSGRRAGVRRIGLRTQRGDRENQQSKKPKPHFSHSTIAVEGSILDEKDSVRNETEPNWLAAVRAAQEKQATGIRVLDLRKITTFTDYFVICSGSNARQNQTITDEIERKLRERGERPHSIEGYEQGEWILSDYGDFLVHVFSPKSREYYSLERLWREAGDVPVPAEAAAR